MLISLFNAGRRWPRVGLEAFTRRFVYHENTDVTAMLSRRYFRY